jgi:hypothetical protein
MLSSLLFYVGPVGEEVRGITRSYALCVTFSLSGRGEVGGGESNTIVLPVAERVLPPRWTIVRKLSLRYSPSRTYTLY